MATSYRLLGLPEEIRLEFEQAGIKTQTATVLIETAVNEAQALSEDALREIQSIIGPHGAISRVQAGGIRISPGEGIGIFVDGVLKTTMETDGDLLVGSNITNPATTTFCCFVNDQTYNNETMGAGDLLIGDNSTGESNVKYDASAGQLQFRYGSTVNVYVDTDGKLKAGGGVVILDANGVSIVASTGAEGIRAYKFIDGSGNELCAMYGYTIGTSVNISLGHPNSNTIKDSSINLAAYTGDTASDAAASVSISAVADNSASARIYVGASGTDPGQIVINSDGDDIDTFIKSESETYAIHVDASADTVYIGGNTNAVKVARGGELTLIGTATRFDDLRVEPTARTTGANAPTFEKWLDDSAGTSRGVYLYSFDDAVGGSEKEMFFEMQMPHNWKEGSAIYMHIHWIGAVDDTTAAPRWALEYAWKDIGEVFGDTVIVYSDGTNYVAGGTDANVTALKHYISKFAAITPGTTQDGLSSVLIGRLYRDSADAGDTYNAVGAKVGLLYIDAHYEIDSMGSSSEYTK